MYYKNYYVYIVTNRKNGTLYIGVTNNIEKRIDEHKDKVFKGFTQKYDCDKLVYFEHYNEIKYAINREKQLKHWVRKDKIKLIEKENPGWEDLSKD